MKDINVSELKARLSKYLRITSRGSRIIVREREPIAQIGPPPGPALLWHDRLAPAGRLRPGAQDWGVLKTPGSTGTWISRRLFAPCVRIPMKYVDDTAVPRVLFSESGPAIRLEHGNSAGRDTSSLRLAIDRSKASTCTI